MGHVSSRRRAWRTNTMVRMENAVNHEVTGDAAE